MGSTQDVYAANLLQHCGYPLHSPEPRGELGKPYDEEGFQIGDTGHINGEGEFNPLFNICLPLPGGLRTLGFPEHKPIDFGDPYCKHHALRPGHVFMTGVNREVNASSLGTTYEFTAKSDAGAVLILPSGATLFDLAPDKFHLESFRQAAAKYARLWCERSGHDSLYLVTGMYKTRDFTLASFTTGHRNGKIRVEPVAGTYNWTCAFEAYSRASPPDNSYQNQTILVKGFRMTVRWSWLAVVERVTRAQSPIGRRIASLIATTLALLQAVIEMVYSWLSRTSVEYIPHVPRSSHPSESINRYLLDKNPQASVAITHDNEWIDMLKKKRLPPEDLMREDRLRAFLEREYKWDSDCDVVYLRSQIGDIKDMDQNSESSQPMPMEENVRAVITHMRVENVTVGLERVPVGFYVQVDIADHPYKRTKNKSMLVYDHVIQWDDVIHLPSDLSTVVKLTVCASYEFSPMLGRGEPLHVLEKNVGELLNQTHPFVFSDKEGEDPSPSLLVAVQRWHCNYQTPDSNEADVALDSDGCLWPTEVTETTNKGHETLRRYYADHSQEDLKHGVTFFKHALISCLHEHSCLAAALCNLAGAEFITYRSCGSLHHFQESLTRYWKALELRRDDHQDRPLTLLYLAQALLYYSRTTGSDAFHKDEPSKLLNELKNICPEGTHGRRAADLVFQTHELFVLRDSDDLEKLNELISTLDTAAQEPPDAYFDRPARFNNLGLALQKRFQLGGNAVDLDRAVEWFQKAVRVTPTKHHDRSEYVSNLSDALLARSQRERAVPLTGNCLDQLIPEDIEDDTN